MAERERCKTCRFWSSEDRQKDLLAECKRNPPIIVYNPNFGEDLTGRWPITYANEWCGEYQSHLVELPIADPPSLSRATS